MLFKKHKSYNKMIKQFIAFCFLALLCLMPQTEVIAQSKTFDKVSVWSPRAFGTIINDKVINGYYSFNKVDKVDRKNNEYLLQIIDANLNNLGRKSIIDSKSVTLLESAYNGKNILMKFYDYKAKAVDYRVYNPAAELVYKKTRKLERRWEIANYSKNTGNAEITNNTVFAVKDKGFVEYNSKKEKKTGYEIRFIPNDKGERGWTKGSKEDSKEHEGATFIGANNKLILSEVVKQKSMLSTKNITYHILAQDATTGKKVFQKELKDSRYELALLNAYLKEDGSNEIAVLGQFYAKGDNTVKDKSLGLFSFVYNIEGELLNKNFAKWATDVAEFVPTSLKGKMKDVGYVHFHEVVQTADGKIYAIGETYRRTVSALGILGAATGNGNSVTKIVIEDIAMFEFSPEFKLQDVKFYEKSKSDINLDGVGDFTRLSYVAKLIEAQGFFDYEFTQRTKANDEFTVGYVDFQRNKGAKNELVFGAISLVDGESSVDKITLSKGIFERNTRVLPAKPGYVVLINYNRKEKTTTWTLEKINK